MAAAASLTLVPVDEYLRSVYEPDVEYIDGVLEARNMGEMDHVLIQRALMFALAKGERLGGYLSLQELRVQITPTLYRVPDTCLLPADRLPKRIVTEAPLLCIEVLSPEDRFSRTQRKCEDYLGMGVPEVWIFDPQERKVTVLRSNSMAVQKTGTLPIGRTGAVLDLDEVFGAAEHPNAG